MGPQTFEAEKLGLKTVAHSSDCNARQPILLVANMDYANKHKGDIVAFLRVYLRSVDMMKKTPPRTLPTTTCVSTMRGPARP